MIPAPVLVLCAVLAGGYYVETKFIKPALVKIGHVLKAPFRHKTPSASLTVVVTLDNQPLPDALIHIDGVGHFLTGEDGTVTIPVPLTSPEADLQVSIFVIGANQEFNAVSHVRAGETSRLELALKHSAPKAPTLEAKATLS